MYFFFFQISDMRRVHSCCILQNAQLSGRFARDYAENNIFSENFCRRPKNLQVVVCESSSHVSLCCSVHWEIPSCIFYYWPSFYSSSARDERSARSANSKHTKLAQQRCSKVNFHDLNLFFFVIFKQIAVLNSVCQLKSFLVN